MIATELYNVNLSDLLCILVEYKFCLNPEKYFLVGVHPQEILERSLGWFVAGSEELQRKINFPDKELVSW